MVDIVIPLGKGSAWDNNELRYSLRSIEKHLKNYRNVYIVGECPEWLQNIIHLPFKEVGHASQNIMHKIMMACNIKGLSDNFMFWNDDFFLLKNIDAPSYPFYHKDELYKSIPLSKGNYYQEYITDTMNTLASHNRSTLNFDCHTPIIYNKQKFILAMSLYDFNKKLTVKSLYCNTFEIKGELIEDCKISGRMAAWRLQQKIKDKHIFSTSEKCLDPYPGEKESSVKVLLRQLYPNKSKYEI